MALYDDYEIVDCTNCKTDDYLMDIIVWTKYDYVCTNCDALIEITAQVKAELDPDCICGNSMIISIGTSPGNAPIITDVSNITPNQVVKINTNPYN
jgi:hypothetical protein